MELKIVPKDQFRIQDAKNLIEHVREKEFETVIIFGMKDGKVYTYKSACEGVLATIGALECAKAELMQAGGYIE